MKYGPRKPSLNPRKAAYNKVYNRTTFDLFKLIGKLFK